MLALDSDVCPTPVTRTVAPLNTYTFLKVRVRFQSSGPHSPAPRSSFGGRALLQHPPSVRAPPPPLEPPLPAGSSSSTYRLRGRASGSWAWLVGQSRSSGISSSSAEKPPPAGGLERRDHGKGVFTTARYCDERPAREHATCARARERERERVGERHRAVSLCRTVMCKYVRRAGMQ